MRRIIGWFLFSYGILGILYTLATLDIWFIIGAVLVGVPCILLGWALAHRSKQTN